MNSDFKVNGRRVLITGATSGLGLEMARALVKQGGRVIITGRDEKKLESALTSMGASSDIAIGALMDVRDENSVVSAIDSVIGRWSGIDVLINNAGIGMKTVNPSFLTDPIPFWEIPLGKFRDLIETNLTGYFTVAKQVVPHFLKQGKGRIINISMNHETMKRKGFIPYGPSRAGTESLSHIMAEDLAPFGINVNMLLPGGATDTGMTSTLPLDVRSQLLPADIIAEPVCFLCSDLASRISNERLVAKEFKQWLKHRIPELN